MTEPSSSSPQQRFWIFLALFFVAFIWVLHPILLPFVAGAVIAYLLDPLVKRLVRYKFPRPLGAALVLLLFLLLVVLLLLLIVPLLQAQLASFIAAVPSYVEHFRARALPTVMDWLNKLSPHEVEKLQTAVSSYMGNAALWFADLLKQMISGGFAIVDVVTLIVITPVVAFYFLRDWPDVTESADSLVPRRHISLFRQALSEINTTLSGFLRGQALVCLCLGIIYSVGLSMAGLKYGATIGIIAGFLSFIPYVGSGFVLISSSILALIQFDAVMPILRVLLVFVVGQTLEGYVLTPKLVGDRVGLHPVWILFALFAGASLLGFVGVLIAVPLAAIIGVLIRLALRHYRNSSLYERRKKRR